MCLGCDFEHLRIALLEQNVWLFNPIAWRDCFKFEAWLEEIVSHKFQELVVLDIATQKIEFLHDLVV